MASDGPNSGPFGERALPRNPILSYNTNYRERETERANKMCGACECWWEMEEKGGACRDLRVCVFCVCVV